MPSRTNRTPNAVTPVSLEKAANKALNWAAIKATKDIQSEGVDRDNVEARIEHK